MINLHKKNSIGKKLILSTCLVAFIGNSFAPLAYSLTANVGVYQNGTQANTQKQNQQSVKASPIPLKGEITLAKGKQRIAVSLRDSDVKQVLRMFADKVGLNVVFHSSVSGNITLDLVNVTLNDAFNMIMEMAELTYTIENNTLMVASAKDSKKLNFNKEIMAAIPVKHINANEVAVFLNKNIFTKGRPGLSNSEIAVSNPRENEVLIFGSRSDYKIAEKVIAELDKPLKITSYTVSHTTPKEMANLVCNTLLKDKGTKGDDLTKNSDSEIAVSGGVVQCSVDSKDETQGELQSFKTQGLKIAYFPALGVIKLYGGTAQQAEDIRKLIADADKKQPQAMLEISIVALTENGSKILNNTWTIYSKFFSGTIGGSGISNTGSSFQYYPMLWSGNDRTDFYDLVSGTLTNVIARWTGTPIIANNINWVIQNGEGRTLSTPKIMVTNGQKSTIDMTSDYIKSTKTQYLDNGSLSSQVQKTYEIGSDNGMKITFTPFISPEGYVSLNAKVDSASPNGGITDKSTGDTIVTLLQRKNIDLKNVRIKDGETLVIGGLIEETEKKDIGKAPILGDIPGIGWLFRSSTTTKQKNELVIMITPHIVKDAEDLVESAEIETL